MSGLSHDKRAETSAAKGAVPPPEVRVSGNAGALDVLIFTEHLNATYFISFERPLRKLHAMGKVNFAAVSQRHVKAAGTGCWDAWADALQPDVVVMSRYALPFGPEIMGALQRFGVPVIYHIDDNLLDIPDSLTPGVVEVHGAQDVVDARAWMLGNCDLIYASTRELAGVLERRFVGRSIVHGEVYASYEPLSPAAPALGPVVGYMGSRGHQNDLDLAAPALERLLEQRPALVFEVFGSIQMPERLRRFGPRARARSVQKSYAEFLETLAGLGWSIGLAPLVDEAFNRCKAPTKFIEYSSAGIACIASRSPVYGAVIPEGAGQLVRDEWEAAISHWLDHPGEARKSAVAARAYCAVTFSLERLCLQVEAILVRASTLSGASSIDPAVVQLEKSTDSQSWLASQVLQHSIRNHTQAKVRFRREAHVGKPGRAMRPSSDAAEVTGIGLPEFADTVTQPWIYARHPEGHRWMAEVRSMIDAGELDWPELGAVIASGKARPSLIRDVRWCSRLPRPLRWLAGWANTIADRLQGFPPRSVAGDGQSGTRG